MPIIIDGWNFIRDKSSRARDEEEDSLKAAGLLIGYLEAFQSTHNDPIILVFDSSRGYLDLGYQNSRKLKVVAAKDADGYIKRYIDAIPERQRRNFRVISSDNDVYYYARDSYATAIRCGEFWDKLTSDGKGGLDPSTVLRVKPEQATAFQTGARRKLDKRDAD